MPVGTFLEELIREHQLGGAQLVRNPKVPDELIAKPLGGDPNLPVVLIPPYGWIADPESDDDGGFYDGGVICGDCTSAKEISEYMALLEQIAGSTRSASETSREWPRWATR